MENRIKRFLGVALVLLLIVSVLPMSISAEETAATPVDVIGNGPLGSAEESSPVYIGEQGYATLAAAISDAESGATITIKADGSYSLPGFSKDLTIEAAEGVAAEFAISSVVTRQANVNFKNVTFTFATNSTYKGLQFTSIVFDNCVINGQAFLYSGSETFNNCTFNTTDANNYNVWTYGAKNVTFNGCTFNCAGKSILVYNEGVNGTVVTFSNSKLIASAPVEGKAAIEIDSTYLKAAENEKYVIAVDAATTVTGFANGNVSGNSIWNNKKGALAEVTVNGEKVLTIGAIEVEKEVSEIVDGAEGTAAETIVLQLQANTALTDKEPENVPENAELVIELTGVTVENDVTTELVYDVTPMMGEEKVENLTEEIIFRLPVHASVTVDHVRVYHDGEFMGVKEIQGTAPNRYVEISSAEFSEYALMPLVLGDDPIGYTSENTIWGETWGSALESYAIKVYSGDTYMGSTTLNPELYTAFDGDVSVTWHISLDPESDTDSYWIQEWTVAPSLTVQPDRVELWIDGVKAGEGAVQMNGPDNLNKIVAFVVDADGAVKGYYTTLANALDAAPDGGTVKLISGTDGAAISAAGKVTGNKTVTLTGEAKFDWRQGTLYVGREDRTGDGKLIIKDAKITSDEASLMNGSYGIHVSGASDQRKVNNGVLEIINSDIQLSYLINRNETVIDNSELYVGRGFYIHGRAANESPTEEDQTATITIKNGAVVEVKENNGTGIGDESYGVMNVENATFIAHEAGFPVRSNGVINVSGESTVKANFAENGMLYLKGAELDENTSITGKVKVRAASGVNTIDGATVSGSFFQVGVGAYHGVDTNVDTVNGVTVNVKNNAVIGADGSDYAGWVGSGYYAADADKAAVMTDAKYILNIENSQASFGYLHVSNDGIVNVKGHTDNKITDSSTSVDFYAGNFIINGKVTFDGTDAWAKFTKVSCDNGTENPGTLVIQNGTYYEASIHNGSTTGTALTLYKTGIVEINGSTVEVDNGTSIAADAKLNVADSSITAKGTVTNNGAFAVSGKCSVKVSNLAAGTIEIAGGSELTDTTIAGAGTTYFYEGVTNFYGANSVTSSVNGEANFDLVVNKGANLAIERYVLGYDRDITVYGQIEDATALTAEQLAEMVPSLTFTNNSGMSVNGWGTSVLTVKDAYVNVSGTTLKGSADGTYTWNFENAYVKAKSMGTTNAAGEGGSWTVTFSDSVLEASSYIKTAVGVTYNFTNGSKATADSMRIDGTLNIESGSEVKITAYQNNTENGQGEHGDISGTVNVAGVLNIGSNSATTVELLGGELNVNGGQVILNDNSLSIDGASKVTVAVPGTIQAKAITGAANITVDAAKLAMPEQKVIDVDEAMDGDITVKYAASRIGENDLYVYAGAYIDSNEDGMINEGEGYATLADALAAAKDRDTVVMLQNVEGSVVLDKSITLDMNGCSITAVGSENDDWAVKVAAEVEIKDSSDVADNGITVTGNGFGIWVEDNCGVTLSNITVTGHNAGIKTFGNVTVSEGAIITATKTTEGCGDGIRAYGDAIVTVNGGEIKTAENGAKGYGIELYQSAKAFVNDGKVTGKTGICVYGGTLEVNGGTITGTSEYGLCTTSWGDDSIISKADVTINGGTINGKVVIEKDDNGALPAGYAASVAITGGTVNGELVVQEENAIYTMAVSGGSFEQVVPEKFCAAGYSPVTEPNAEGRYEVKLGYVLNVNTGVNYATIEDAMEAAGNGHVLKLLQAVSEGDVVIRNDVTLDLNGQVLTADYVVSFQGSHLIDSLSTGLLKGGRVKLCADNEMMPVWVEKDGQTGYQFFTMIDYQKYRWQKDNSFQFISKPAAGAAANDKLIAEAAKNEHLTVKMRLSWTNASENEVEQTFIMKKDDVHTVYTVDEYLIQLTVTGTANYKDLIYTTTVIESDTGVVWAGDPLQYTGAQAE